LGLVDKSLACPLVGLHAISAACPEARCFRERLGSPQSLHEAPRFTPWPYSMIEQKNPKFERRCHAFQGSRPQGLATLSTVSALLPLEASFSFPRSWALLFRALFQPGGRTTVSRGPSAPTLSCQTQGPDIDAPAVSAHPASCASCPRFRVRSRVEPLLS
jgi:hypothetical protein